MKAIVVKAAATILLVGGLFIACIVNWLGPITETSIISGKENNSGSEGITEPPIVYVTSADELPMETIAELALAFLAETEDGAEDDFLFTYTDPQLYGVYFLTLKPEEQYGYRNVLKIVVYYDEYLRGEYYATIYEPLDFYNLTINEDGTVSGLEYDAANSGTFNTNIEEHIAKYDDYDITILSFGADG